MKNNNITLGQIEATVSATFKEMEEGMKSSGLTSKEKSELVSALEKLEFKAYCVKMNLYLDDVMESSPEIPIRDVFIYLLPHLRPDTSAEMITQVTKYISQEWEARRLKVAA